MDTPKIPCNAENDLIQAVHDAYDARGITGATVSYSERISKAFGYSPEQLKAIPSESNMGLSCGNPVAAASIKEVQPGFPIDELLLPIFNQGENVLDLGCGGGIDIFLAASKIGSTGQAVGLDMSLNMIQRARKNAKQQNLTPPHVAFIHTRLTDPLPIASNSIDCVLSNCVINLLPPSGKAHVIHEVNRVLKPGGRFVLDDIIAKTALPEDIRKDMASYVGCISGAIILEEYQQLLASARFQDITFVDTKGDINVYYQDTAEASGAGCCGAAELLKPAPDFNANRWVASYQIYALKPDLQSEQTVISQSPLMNWSDAYPAVQSTGIPKMSIEDVAALIRDPAQNNYAVIDVRRNDHAGGHVRGSSQWPAQTFYDNLEKFFETFKETERVIFYCGSSNGRGPRCAGWYQDHMSDMGVITSKAYVLEGGVKAWLQEFRAEGDLVDSD